MNAVTLLTQEHQKLRPFLRRMAQACDKENQDALNTVLEMAKTALNADLDQHIDLEDNRVFPHFAQYIGSDMVRMFIDDHRQIQSVRDTLYSAETPCRRSLALALDEMLQEHLDREENMLFPAAENEMPLEALELEPD